MTSNHLQGNGDKQHQRRIPVISYPEDSADAFGTHPNEPTTPVSRPERPMLSRDNVASRSQLTLRSTATNSSKLSWHSGKSALRTVSRKLSKSFEQTKPAIEAAAAASKRVASATTSKLNQLVSKPAAKTEEATSDLSRTSSLSSTKSLFQRRRLPKLVIPDLSIAVEDALNSVCSTDTQKSPNYQLLEQSPTSRHLKDVMLSDGHSDDVAAEFHNMLSARRRVRKGKFGTQVMDYRLARPTWDSSWVTRSLNDNMEDRELLKALTDAVQEQKDEATRRVQRNPGAYPELLHVSSPGSTLKMYWQNKSSYR
ncbi:hypothetical protein GGS21DRAFT_499367 [Xylaria nigripes]|nr:hypothetical protein GGS21DRAFT_499367 [Xylaria nigripes]